MQVNRSQPAWLAKKMRAVGVGRVHRAGRSDTVVAPGLNLDLVKCPGLLDQIYAWRRMSPDNQALHAATGGTPMPQQQFTIEIRVDYADKDKYEIMRAACRKAGQHLYATAELISDKVKPQIAIFSDDFFDGHKDIDLIDNTIERGRDELAAAGDDSPEGAAAVSDELLEALRDTKEKVA